MRIRDPYYLYVSQAGRFSVLFAACATWLLGFGTWQVLYVLERIDGSIPISANLAGPDSFVSVLAGDGIALPVMSALVIVFYRVVERLAANDVDKIGDQLTIGGGWQTATALVAAGSSAGFTYASWFAAHKVDWSLPRPGVLTLAALYHATFVTGMVYLLTSYFISVVRVLAWHYRVTQSLPSEQRRTHVKLVLPLLWTTAGISIAADVFALGLLADVDRGLMPLSTFLSSELLNSVLTLLVLALGVAVIARFAWRLLFTDGRFQVLALVALLGALVPLLVYRQLLGCCTFAVIQ